MCGLAGKLLWRALYSVLWLAQGGPIKRKRWKPRKSQSLDPNGLAHARMQRQSSQDSLCMSPAHHSNHPVVCAWSDCVWQLWNFRIELSLSPQHGATFGVAECKFAVVLYFGAQTSSTCFVFPSSRGCFNCWLNAG